MRQDVLWQLKQCFETPFMTEPRSGSGHNLQRKNILLPCDPCAVQWDLRDRSPRLLNLFFSFFDHTEEEAVLNQLAWFLCKQYQTDMKNLQSRNVVNQKGTHGGAINLRMILLLSMGSLPASICEAPLAVTTNHSWHCRKYIDHQACIKKCPLLFDQKSSCFVSIK